MRVLRKILMMAMTLGLLSPVALARAPQKKGDQKPPDKPVKVPEKVDKQKPPRDNKKGKP